MGISTTEKNIFPALAFFCIMFVVLVYLFGTKRTFTIDSL